MNPLPAELAATLEANADAADREPAWPAAFAGALQASGVLAAAVPPEYGGNGHCFSQAELFDLNESLAAACATTAFALSQRDAAVRRIAAGPQHLQAKYLPGLARGELFATVGLSQLTTSRQHGRPAVLVTPTPGGFTIDGEIPWVTGADRADVTVIAGVLADGTQAVFALPKGTPGVTVGDPMPLAALAGSRTATVRLDHVELDAGQLLAGPVPDVLGKLGGGGLDTSNLALGVSAAAVRMIAATLAYRPDLADAVARLQRELGERRDRIRQLAASPEPDAVLSLRADCTRFALSTTQAALTLAKGAGFVAPHPAQRLARQALFFLVWSCPRPVADGVLAELLGA